MERFFFYWVLVIVQVVAVLIAWRDFAKLKANLGTYCLAWKAIRRNTWKRPVILGAMYSVIAILVLPILVYPFSDGISHIKDTGLHHAGDYGLFAFPALAGVVAGGGLVWGRDEGEVVNDKNVGFYIVSIVLLLLTHVIYLKMNFRPAVVAASGLFVSITAMLVLWRRAHSEAGSEVVRQSRLGFSAYELGYALVMIVPPFLLFLLTCSVIVFWKWLFTL